MHGHFKYYESPALHLRSELAVPPAALSTQLALISPHRAPGHTPIFALQIVVMKLKLLRSLAMGMQVEQANTGVTAGYVSHAVFRGEAHALDFRLVVSTLKVWLGGAFELRDRL